MRLCRGDDETHNEECKDNKLSNLIESKTASCGNKVKYLPKMQSFYGVYVPTDSRVDNKGKINTPNCTCLPASLYISSRIMISIRKNIL